MGLTQAGIDQRIAAARIESDGFKLKQGLYICPLFRGD